MAEKAPGKQLSKYYWLVLVFFLLVTGVGAGALLLNGSSSREAASRLERVNTYVRPMLEAGEKINTKALYLQIGLLRYIADYDSDPNTVVTPSRSAVNPDATTSAAKTPMAAPNPA